MRLLRKLANWRAGLYVAVAFLDIAHGLYTNDTAEAQQYPLPYVTAPQDAPLNNTLNSQIIQPLNNFLAGRFPTTPQGTTGTNIPALQGGNTSQPVIFGASGTDTNINIGISPQGTGNIVLFSPSPAGGSTPNTGMLVFGNQLSWVPGDGVTRCPGTAGGAQFFQPGVGGGAVVTGYFVVADWLGRPHKVLACG